MGVSPKLGVPFVGPNNRVYNVLGSIFRAPCLGKLRRASNGIPELLGLTGIGKSLPRC